MEQQWHAENDICKINSHRITFYISLIPRWLPEGYKYISFCVAKRTVSGAEMDRFASRNDMFWNGVNIFQHWLIIRVKGYKPLSVRETQMKRYSASRRNDLFMSNGWRVTVKLVLFVERQTNIFRTNKTNKTIVNAAAPIYLQGRPWWPSGRSKDRISAFISDAQPDPIFCVNHWC